MVGSLPLWTGLQCDHTSNYHRENLVLPAVSASSLPLTTSARITHFCCLDLLLHLEALETYAMDTDISQCPENSNSTDCLLRSLLQLLKDYREADNAATDWDPISFAFTLLIGLVALLFALAAVMQAIFAAGNGRRRTNHLAIGKWNVETKRQWDWSEMNFRYTVTTPILHEEFLQSLEDYDKMNHFSDKNTTGEAVQTGGRKFWATVKSIASCLHPNQYLSSESHPNQSRQPSAAWLEFFKEVGLDEWDVKAWGTNTRKVVADYLPDDITAAPAYAQVGAIVAAAVMAGIQKVDIDKQASRNYPILFGQGFQIDFRQHPALGVVGAYSRYDKASRNLRRLDIEELKSAMKNGRGFVDDQKIMDLSTESTRRQLIGRWSRLAEAHAITCESWSALFALNSSAISEAHLPLIIGMFANRPEHVPALFPTATMRNTNCLATLALCGKYWAELHLDTFKPGISGRRELERTPNWDRFEWHSGTDWESNIGSGAHELYHKYEMEEDHWGGDILKGWIVSSRAFLEEFDSEGDSTEGWIAGAKAIMEALSNERKASQVANRARCEKETPRINEVVAKPQAEKKEQDAAEKTHSEDGTAATELAGARSQVEEEEQVSASRPQLEEDASTAEAAGERPQAEEERAHVAVALKAPARPAEARFRVKKRATDSDASTEGSREETEAEATIGHGLVLQMCLDLLHRPAVLDQWFSEASSDGLRFLKSLVLEQIKHVDQWLRSKLRDKESIRHRSILLCNTTIVLLRIEQMIDNNFFDSSDPGDPQGHGMQDGSVEQQQRQSSNRGRLEQGLVSRTHFNILQMLCNMIDGVDGLHGTVRGASELESLLHDRSPSNLLWDRLKAIVVYHSKDERPLYVQFKHEKDEKATRDIDDVIIYRCLMMVLLFRTAADSSKILESGIWDQVVPII